MASMSHRLCQSSKLSVTLILLNLLAAGCHHASPEADSPAATNTSKSPRVESFPTLLPVNIFSGEPWEVGVLPLADARSILEKPMPKRSAVAPDTDNTQAIESATGMSIHWVPELSPEDSAKLKRMKYRDVAPADEDTGTVGEALTALLTGTTEFGMHSNLTLEEDQPNFVNAAFLTKHCIVIVAIPDSRAAPK
jgi:hypothetical protein